MERFNINDINNILIIQTAFLGDVILTIPLINNMKRLWPKKKIAVLTTPIGREILSGISSIDNIVVYDKKGKDKGIKNYFDKIYEINCLFFDLVILPHRSFRSAFMAWKADIPHRWGFNTSEGSWFLTKKIQYKKEFHEVDRNLEFLKEFTEKFNKEISFPHNGKMDEPIIRMLKNKDFVQDKIVGIHPGSVWQTKRWPLDKFVELINKLQTQGYKVIIFGDKFDVDISYTVNKHFDKNKNVLNMIGKTSIKELVTFIRQVAVYVTNDSGPMHIAAAVGKPMVAIFGPTTKSLGFFPYTDKAIVLEKDLSCRPCGKHGGRKCPKKHFKCMNDITVNEVYDSIIKMKNIK